MIEWINVKDALPEMHEQKDEDGYSFKCSDTVLCWDGKDDEPIALGILEDGKWYANGIGQPDVTHWAVINNPEGEIVHGDFRGGW